MKTILKKSTVLTILSILLIFFIVPVFAHPGSLDENGGHYDRSTGEYHYHHGYSAHQHENGECPYDFHDNANTEYNPNTNSSSSSSSYKPSEPTTREETTRISNYNSSFHKTKVPLILGIVLGFLFSIFVSWMIFSFFSPIIRNKTKHKESEKESIEEPEPKKTILTVKQLDNATTEPQIDNPTPQQNNTSLVQQNKEPTRQQDKTPTEHQRKLPTKQNNIVSTEQSNSTKEQKIYEELLSFSLSDLIGSLPSDIKLKENLELDYPTSDNKKYGKYTIYIEQKTFIIHRNSKCNESKKNTRLSLEYSIGAKYSLCLDCWTNKQIESSVNLFMPEWYSEYKKFIKKLKSNDFTVNRLLTSKQLRLGTHLMIAKLIKWTPDVHTTYSQMQKIYKAKSVTILSYDHETKKAKIQGSNGEIYITSFTTCTCKDFSLHNLPCKHIYKYFAEYGGIDFSKYI